MSQSRRASYSIACASKLPVRRVCRSRYRRRSRFAPCEFTHSIRAEAAGFPAETGCFHCTRHSMPVGANLTRQASSSGQRAIRAVRSGATSESIHHFQVILDSADSRFPTGGLLSQLFEVVARNTSLQSHKTSPRGDIHTAHVYISRIMQSSRNSSGENVIICGDGWWHFSIDCGAQHGDPLQIVMCRSRSGSQEYGSGVP